MLNKVPSITSLGEPGERYVLEEPLATGIEATVWRGVVAGEGGEGGDDTGCRVAIKVQRLRPDNQSYLQEELRILSTQTDHPNLPAFYGAYKKNEDVWFVMEVCLLDFFMIVTRISTKDTDFYYIAVHNRQLKYTNLPFLRKKHCFFYL